jgi:hypothetical protein
MMVTLLGIEAGYEARGSKYVTLLGVEAGYEARGLKYVTLLGIEAGYEAGRSRQVLMSFTNIDSVPRNEHRVLTPQLPNRKKEPPEGLEPPTC